MNGNCEKSLYIALGSRLGQGLKLTVEGIHGFVQAYAPVPISPVLQPPPAAAAAEVAALPAAGTFGSLTREVEDERLLS